MSFTLSKNQKRSGTSSTQQSKNSLKKLAKRLIEPIAPSDKLSGYENVYKIKLRSSGYRLAYEVKEDKIIIVVLAIGKREKTMIYITPSKTVRLSQRMKPI